MFYIHQSSCISAQKAFSDSSETSLTESINNKLYACGSNYDMIPPNTLRRLGKAVKMGIATGMQIIAQQPVDGIVIGTANGGLEDCIKFLNQVIEFEEGRLTPTNFVQSTTNAIAGQLGIMTANKGYNITHVHRGLAFENALIDTEMLLQENPERSYLIGGVDEISEYNYTIDTLAGCYKKEDVSNKDLLHTASAGSMAGEGAAMFLVSNSKENAQASIRAIKTLHAAELNAVEKTIQDFIQEHVSGKEKIDLILSGKNGDNRLDAYYEKCLGLLPANTPVGYYKQLTGEFSTATAVALWIAVKLLTTNRLNALLEIPETLQPENILLYNTCRGNQHSLILISKP
ncbi:MAG: beta-ketoacyl synthase chain length factor [Cytophaga sp.]|uniref:beta-ketoacyl synthase chain length factor n=1 Tax=Cytophaga sp. TaxID=29535 RepID=UPI003F801667